MKRKSLLIIVTVMSLLAMSLSACTSSVKEKVSDITKVDDANIRIVNDEQKRKTKHETEVETQAETETESETKIEIVPKPQSVPENSTFSVSFKQPLEETLPTEKIEVATQTPTQKSTDSETNYLFATVIKDTTITVKDSSNSTNIIVSEGKEVVVIKEQINSYLIKWYEKTAIISKDAVKLYDTSFIPDFSKKSWIGIGSSSLISKRYGVCVSDTEVIIPDSLQSLYKGQKVAITEIGDTTYVIEWYGEKAFVKAEDIEIFPENYEPIFESGSWAGCITDSPISNHITERYGICINDTDIVTPTSIEPLYKGQSVHIEEIGDTTYVIEWYGEKALVKAEDIEIFPENYEPIFESGSWAGCIKK